MKGLVIISNLFCAFSRKKEKYSDKGALQQRGKKINTMHQAI